MPLQRISLAAVYPRVCGGTDAKSAEQRTALGLSPRVRGNQREVTHRTIDEGSIPACAGEPTPKAAQPCRTPVYPRVCGGT